MPQSAPGPNAKGGHSSFTNQGAVARTEASGPTGPRGPTGPTGPTGATGPVSFPDAPSDGHMYVRQNGAWVEMPGSP
jgi:hypothetical protein